MPTITVGSRTLTIPTSITPTCATHIKAWYNLSGDTPAQILDAWSAHTIEEVKRYLIDKLGQDAWNAAMTDSEAEAQVAKDAAETSADNALVIS